MHNYCPCRQCVATTTTKHRVHTLRNVIIVSVLRRGGRGMLAVAIEEVPATDGEFEF